MFFSEDVDSGGEKKSKLKTIYIHLSFFQKQIISSGSVRYCELSFLSLNNVILNSIWWFHWHERFDSSAANQLIFFVDSDSKDFNLSHKPTQITMNILSHQPNPQSYFRKSNAKHLSIVIQSDLWNRVWSNLHMSNAPIKTKSMQTLILKI